MTFDGRSALTERERQVILHVLRYWLTTINIVHQWLWPDLLHDAVRKAISRLTERGWLARHVLDGQESYFVLSHKALAALGIRRSTGPLGHQALLDHYAVLLACARRQSDVFTEDEVRSQFPDVFQPGQSVKHFFRDASCAKIRLGYFIVDHDKLTSRMVNKLGNLVGKMMNSDRPKMRQFLLNGEIAFHILTATEGKRANLEAAFARKPLDHVPVFVESYPDELGGFFLLNRR
jgi:hypothetical protein